MFDAKLAILAPAWSDDEVSLESAPTVTGTEVAEAGSYLDKWKSPGCFPPSPP